MDTLAHRSASTTAAASSSSPSNPYAAMPSLHSADALIVGVTLARSSVRAGLKVLWLLWPAWVWFSVMATANHFWLDIAAGVRVAALARRDPEPRRGILARRAPRDQGRSSARASREPDLHGRRPAAGGRARMQRPRRRRASHAGRADRRRREPVHRGLRRSSTSSTERSWLLLARRRLFVSARSWTSSTARSRASGKGTPFGAFIDSTHRSRRRGVHARLDRARLHAATGTSGASRSRSRRSPAPSS